MTKAPWWWRIRRWDPARVKAVRVLFAVSRYCTEQSNDPKYGRSLSREDVAGVVQRHPWLIEADILAGRK